MNSTFSLILKIVLGIVIIYLAYMLYSIIQEPIRFEKLKTKRYEKVQERLEQIRDAQKVYRAEYGRFADSMDELVAFVDTGKQSIVERKDSSFAYYNKVFQQEMQKDTIVTKILGYQSVKKSLFGEDFDASSLAVIPETDGEKIEMSATKIRVNDVIVPVFEASASNVQIFGDVLDQYDQFIDEEYALKVGSLTEPKLSGNWK